MLATPNELYSELSGSMKKYEMYARKNVYNPETRILQHKPNRKLKPGESKNAEVERTNQVLLRAKERAKAIYHDPEQKAIWLSRYQALESECQQKGNRHINGGKANRKNGGYDLPRLFWPWLYGECLREEYQTPP